MSLLLLVPGFLILAVLRGAGGALVRRLGGDGHQPGLSLACGYGLATLGVFVLALAHRIDPLSLGAFVVLLAVPAAQFYRNVPEARGFSIRLPLGKAERLAAVGTGVLLLLAFIQALAPPTGMDSATWHFLAPKLILRSGGLESSTQLWSHRTGGFYMIHLLGMGLGGEILAKLLAFGACLAAADLAWRASERIRAGTGPFGALAVCTSPIFASLAGYEYLEIPTLMYLLAAAFAALVLPNCAGWGLAGALAGFALGIKSTAFPAGAFALMLLGLPPFALRRVSLREAATAAAAAIVPAGFWPAWNFMSSGSPVSYEYSAMLQPELQVTHVGLLGRAFASVIFPSIYYWGESAGPFCVLAVLGCFIMKGGRESRPWAFLFLSAVAMYFIVVVFIMPGYLRIHSHGRHLGPSQIVFGTLAGVGLIGRTAARPRRLLLAALLLPAAVMLAVKIPRALICVPVVLGFESRSEYLTKKIEIFPACELLNRLPEPKVKVLFLGVRQYYLDRDWVGPEVLESVSGPRELLARMRLEGVTHLLYEPLYADSSWVKDAASLEGSALRVLGTWPGGARLLKVD